MMSKIAQVALLAAVCTLTTALKGKALACVVIAAAVVRQVTTLEVRQLQ